MMWNKKLPPPKFKGFKFCRNCGYCEIMSIRFRGRSQTVCKVTNEIRTLHHKCDIY